MKKPTIQLQQRLGECEGDCSSAWKVGVVTAAAAAVDAARNECKVRCTRTTVLCSDGDYVALAVAVAVAVVAEVVVVVGCDAVEASLRACVRVSMRCRRSWRKPARACARTCTHANRLPPLRYIWVARPHHGRFGGNGGAL